ncbi:MAG TPA: asparaginase [Coleofasciculaceae cyanobacterium]
MTLTATFESESEQILVTAARFSVPSCAAGTPNRESYVENRHWGWMIVTDIQHGHLYCTPGADRIATFFRSSAKPFQAAPLVADGYAELLSSDELAITCASHSGSAEHLRLAASVLEKSGLTETALQCGPHMPSDPAMLEKLRESGQQPGALHNNCSGKHAGMLFYCRRAGLDIQTYLDPQHPLQQRILALLKHWGQVSEIPLAVDGCGAPVFYLPLSAMARLFAALGSEPDFLPIVRAMTGHPVIIDGEGRIDTVLMQVSQGQLLAKVGAEGVIGISRVGTGQGLALKIADGSNEIRNLAVVEILHRLGWLDDTALRDPRLAPYRNLDRANTQGKAVGCWKVHFDPAESRCGSEIHAPRDGISPGKTCG